MLLLLFRFLLCGVLILYFLCLCFAASTKRSHEWASSGVGVGVVGGEHIHRQASTSPVRPTVSTVLAAPAPASPSSSNVSVRKKMVSSLHIWSFLGRG